MIYAYAITDRAGRPLPDGLRGAAGEPLAEVVMRGLAAVYGERSALAGGDEPEAELWEHEAVVEALMESRTVLPLRFGTALEGPAELERTLEERHDEFAASLARVRGGVELALRVVETAPAERPPAPDGRSYMLARVAERRELSAVHGELAKLARASRERDRPAPGSLFSAAYLVDRERVEEFRERVESVAGARDGLGVVCTGPWPPYSFTSPEAE